MTRVDIRIRMRPDTTANLRPSGTPAGTYGSWFNIDVPDWWDFSATNDRFNIRDRADGPVEYAYAGGTSGSGTSGSPWSATQLRDRINARSFPTNAVVELEPGNYIGLAGNQQFTGGGAGSSGWVTLLGPANPATPATIEGNWYRGWSMAAGSSRIQMVRLHANQTGLNSAFMSYVDGGGGSYSSDTAGQTQLGANPGCVGFQLDGYNTDPAPGPMFLVNCVSTGAGEPFGSFEAGHIMGVGCVGWESAYASPAGRSSCSVSWNGGGTGNTDEVALFNTNDSTPVFGGWFGCIFARAFQLIPSIQIGNPTSLTDGNGMIAPTDDPNATGYMLNQCNVTLANSGAGITGYNWNSGGGKVINGTTFGNGANTQHRNGTSPFYRPGTSSPLPTGIADDASNGGGPAILMQRYSGSRTTAEILGCVAMGSAYDSSSMTFWGGSINAAGRGNVCSTAPDVNVGTGATGSVGHITASASATLVNPDVTGSTAAADGHLKAGSPAIGEAYLADVDIGFDFAGVDWIERTSGRIDAGAIQYQP